MRSLGSITPSAVSLTQASSAEATMTLNSQRVPNGPSTTRVGPLMARRPPEGPGPRSRPRNPRPTARHRSPGAARRPAARPPARRAAARLAAHVGAASAGRQHADALLRAAGRGERAGARHGHPAARPGPAAARRHGTVRPGRGRRDRAGATGRRQGGLPERAAPRRADEPERADGHVGVAAAAGAARAAWRKWQRPADRLLRRAGGVVLALPARAGLGHGREPGCVRSLRAGPGAARAPRAGAGRGPGARAGAGIAAAQAHRGAGGDAGRFGRAHCGRRVERTGAGRGLHRVPGPRSRLQPHDGAARRRAAAAGGAGGAAHARLERQRTTLPRGVRAGAEPGRVPRQAGHGVDAARRGRRGYRWPLLGEPARGVRRAAPARHAPARGGRQRFQPAGGPGTAGRRGRPRHARRRGRRGCAPGARDGAGLRRHPDGCADARHRRLRGHAAHPGAASGEPDHRDDGQCDGVRPAGLPGRGHARPRGQAGGPGAAGQLPATLCESAGLAAQRDVGARGGAG
ncbi:hypothetical protein OSTOST_11924 [Ostertagia ostertagi]